MLWPSILEATTDGFDDQVESIVRKLRFGLVDVRCVAQTRTTELAVGRATPPPVISILPITLTGYVLDVVAFPISSGRRAALAE
jgi:hypothetical protein